MYCKGKQGQVACDTVPLFSSLTSVALSMHHRNLACAYFSWLKKWSGVRVPRKMENRITVNAWQLYH